MMLLLFLMQSWNLFFVRMRKCRLYEALIISITKMSCIRMKAATALTPLTERNILRSIGINGAMNTPDESVN